MARNLACAGVIGITMLGLAACASGSDAEVAPNALSGGGPGHDVADDSSGAPSVTASSSDEGGEAGDDGSTGNDAEPDPPPDEPDPQGESSGGEDEPEPLPPAPPTCGDAAVDPGEQCDDANAVDGDACVHCQDARCGDGVTQVGVEQCDDGDGEDDDTCLSSCAIATCGDGVLHEGIEVCDDGNNDGSYGGCMQGCAQLGPYCGDGEVAANEHCDPEDQLPFANVECDDDSCLYDFGGIPQLYCQGTCSWAGALGCDQADADLLCKLTTGDAASTASSFGFAYALNAPGFACPGYGVDMGTMPELGVNVTVWYQDANLAATHGAGVVVINPTCT